MVKNSLCSLPTLSLVIKTKSKSNFHRMESKGWWVARRCFVANKSNLHTKDLKKERKIDKRKIGCILTTTRCNVICYDCKQTQQITRKIQFSALTARAFKVFALYMQMLPTEETTTRWKIIALQSLWLEIKKEMYRLVGCHQKQYKSHINRSRIANVLFYLSGYNEINTHFISPLCQWLISI